MCPKGKEKEKAIAYSMLSVYALREEGACTKQGIKM